jgi:hypothetical protein
MAVGAIVRTRGSPGRVCDQCLKAGGGLSIDQRLDLFARRLDAEGQGRAKEVGPVQNRGIVAREGNGRCFISALVHPLG